MGRQGRHTTARTAGAEETPIEEVLKDAESTDFNDEASWKKFQAKHRIRLCKDRHENSGYVEDEVLHKLAERKTLNSQHQAFVVWLIQMHSQLLRCKARGGMTPLHVALLQKNHDFVGLVLDHAEGIKSLMSIRTDLGTTSLHYAIDESSPFTEAIITKVQDTPKASAAAVNVATNGRKSSIALAGDAAGVDDIFKVKAKSQGMEGMTPLHVAVTLSSADDWDVPYVATTSTAPHTAHADFASSKPANRPPEYSKGANQPSTPTTSHPRDLLGREPNGAAAESQELMTEAKPLRRVLTSEMPMNAVPVLQRAASLKTSVAPTGLARPFDPVHIVRELIKARPLVLVDFEDDSGQTPFQARLASLQSDLKIEDVDARQDRKREIQRNELIDKDPILNYMREYIIDKFSRADAMKALYKVGRERVHEFDLSGLPRPSIDPDYLKGLQKVLRFEGLLKYVALPRLVFEAEEGLGVIESNADRSAGHGQGNKINNGKGLQCMYPIFRWLKAQGVNSVLKVTVIDDVEPSHSDQVIEECLGGLNVRIWNWFKVDLCSDVILKSAKNARDVTLYSSGNNAVLKGWSSPEGLAKLEGLERVHIHVQEGLESPKRLEANVTAFKGALGKLRPDVKCTWELHKPDSNYNDVFTDRNGENQPVSKWTKAMEDFAEFLSSARPDPPVPLIKIAIIDDGIDMSLTHLSNMIQVGESFYSLIGELSGRRGAYFVPSGPHGTLMAKAICSMCPKVMLYIAQLEVLPGPHGQRSFTAESATEAIKWAVAQGVDVISMSWSINSSVKIPALHDALQAAEHARIMMFCASIDEGSKASDNTYPARASTSCIKIGACTGDGDKLSWVSEENSKFLLPGDAPVSAPGEKDQWSPHRHLLAGSSVATARAAGLAAALLYCDRLIGAPKVKILLPLHSANFAFQVSPGRSSWNHKEVDLLRSNDKIAEAFSKLSSGSDNHKFPQLWQHLPDIEKLKWDPVAHPTDTGETKSTLDAFMNKLRKLRVGGGEELVQPSSTS